MFLNFYVTYLGKTLPGAEIVNFNIIRIRHLHLGGLFSSQHLIYQVNNIIIDMARETKLAVTTHVDVCLYVWRHCARAIRLVEARHCDVSKARNLKVLLFQQVIYLKTE